MAGAVKEVRMESKKTFRFVVIGADRCGDWEVAYCETPMAALAVVHTMPDSRSEAYMAYDRENAEDGYFTDIEDSISVRWIEAQEGAMV